MQSSERKSRNVKRYHISLIILSLAVSGCARIAQSYVDISEKLGLTPEYDRVAQQAVPQQKSIARPPAGTPDGPFSITATNGRVLKSMVRNGRFDKFVDIYHPNGKLHSHTLIKDGIPFGWSQGYTENGQLRTRILYENGRVVKFQRFDASGKLEAAGNL